MDVLGCTHCSNTWTGELNPGDADDLKDFAVVPHVYMLKCSAWPEYAQPLKEVS